MSQAALCQESVYSTIFREYSKTLYNFLYYKSGDAALAQDLTQEAFLKLWQNCADVKIETAKGYVFMVAKNRLLNVYDHQKVKLRYQKQPQKASSIESPEYLMEEKEFQDRLETGIAALTEKQRVAFLLSRIDKKTYKEIAEILGISKQAVEKRIYTALDVLRKIHKNIK